jgi:hypothetical protein
MRGGRQCNTCSSVGRAPDDIRGSQVRVLSCAPNYSMKLSAFLKQGNDVSISYGISKARTDVIYNYMVDRAGTRTTPYENVSSAILFVFEDFEFDTVQEMLYAFSLFHHNTDAILRAAQSGKKAVRADEKPYSTEDLGNGVLGIGISDEEFGKFFRETLKRSGLDKPPTERPKDGDED